MSSILLFSLFAAAIAGILGFFISFRFHKYHYSKAGAQAFANRASSLLGLLAITIGVLLSMIIVGIFATSVEQVPANLAAVVVGTLSGFFGMMRAERLTAKS